MADFRALFAALLLSVSAAGPAAGAGISQGEGEDITGQYEAAKAKVDAAEREVERAQEQVANAPSTYARLKRQRELETAEEEYRKANRALEKVMRKIFPGTRLWEATHAQPPVETGRMAVPDIGIGRPVDPSELAGVSVHAVQAGPASGDIAYGVPANKGPAPPGAVASPRWKARPISGPSKKAPVSRQRGQPVAETPAPEPVLVSRGSPIHFVGQPVKFLFRQWGAEETRGKNSREAAEEEALIDSAGRNIQFRDFGAALRDADRLIKKRPEDPRVYFLKAMVLANMSRFSEAEAAALRAIRMGLETAEAYETIGWARLHLGRPEDALSAADRALTLDPDSAFAYLIKGMALELLGDERGMRDAIRMAASLNPTLYAGVARSVAAGGKLFDPSAYDNFKLVERRRAGAASRSVWTAWVLALVLVLAGASFFTWLFRRQRPA